MRTEARSCSTGRSMRDARKRREHLEKRHRKTCVRAWIRANPRTRFGPDFERQGKCRQHTAVVKHDLRQVCLTAPAGSSPALRSDGVNRSLYEGSEFLDVPFRQLAAKIRHALIAEWTVEDDIL
jgi:hypothetical protein